MTVQWVGTTGETADPKVYAWVAKGGPLQAQLGTTKPYPMTDFKIFRTELTNLTPGTDYCFQIGKHSPTYRFRTMPAKADDTIHFISGGDCGVNAHTIANNIQAARQDPMFAVIGGDLGYDNGRSVEISLAFLRNYSKHMSRPRRSADPHDRLHRQPRGGRRLRSARARRPLLLRPVRRSVS